MNNKTGSNQEGRRNLILTSLLTFLGMAILIAIAWFLKIPNPNMVLITGLIVFTGMFGRMAGVISASLIILYSMFFFSTDHSFFSYTSINFQKILTIAVSVIINTTIVATLRYRWKKAQAELMRSNKQLKEHNELLKTQSQTDPLTGLYNRHALRFNYDNYIGNNIIVAFMDIDNFKGINDIYGHDAGDEVLRTFSNGLKENFTNTHAYRYGGDEFLLIRNDIDKSFFDIQLHQLKLRMDELSQDDNKPQIKFSTGYVYGVPELVEDMRSMFEQADELMYKAKRCGNKNFLGQRYERLWK